GGRGAILYDYARPISSSGGPAVSVHTTGHRSDGRTAAVSTSRMAAVRRVKTLPARCQASHTSHRWQCEGMHRATHTVLRRGPTMPEKATTPARPTCKKAGV